MILSKELKREDLHRKRTLKKFAFLPTKLYDGTVIWMEVYRIRQQVREHGTLIDYNHNPVYYWRDIKKFK